MIFDENFVDFINLLEKQQARFVLVGGLAVLIHGHFRTTKDMDIFYDKSDDNALKVLNAINEFGFGYLKLTIEDIQDERGYIQLGREPVRIDLFCDLPGVIFPKVYEQAFLYEEDGFKLKVIHINHLIENKTKVGRLQDLDDVKKLKKIRDKRNKEK